jgi:ABC-2 type transport system ATP-binding protein
VTLAVEARGLTKRFGERVAVDSVDLTIETGDVFGYLGPNGAGKTTSLRMMLGLITPTAGRALLFDRDPHLVGARALEGVAGFVEEPRFYPYLSARTNLELCAAYDGGDARSRIDAALDTVDLSDRARDRVGGYSHGMKQRLGIAASLLRSPRLLVLDEPTTGLDPAGMRDMRALVQRLASDGITVLLSSHQLAEVEEVCNRVAIIRSGRILYEGALDGLLRASRPPYRLATTDAGRTVELAAGQGLAAEADGNGTVRVVADEEEAAALTVELGRAGVGIREMVLERPSLEQLFFELVEDGSAPAPVAAERELAESL